MNLMSKSELHEQIGAPSFWSPQRLVDVGQYIAGIPDLDERIGTNNFLKTMPIINVEKHPEGLGFSIMHNFKNLYCGIPKESIVSVTIEKGGVIGQEDKSVIGRAVIGGLLLGPLGALIGGLSGVNNKLIMDNDNLVIQYKSHDGNEQVTLFQIKKGKTNEVFKFLKMHFPAQTTLG